MGANFQMEVRIKIFEFKNLFFSKVIEFSD